MWYGEPEIAPAELSEPQSSREAMWPPQARTGFGTDAVKVTAIRADRMTVLAGSAPTDATSISGVARSVEYLGTTVHVGIDVTGLDTLSAVVPEAHFDSAPVAPGQAVTLSWKPGDVHALGR